MAPSAASVLRLYTDALRGVDPRVKVVAGSSFLFIAARMSLLTFLAIFFVEQRDLALPLVGLGLLTENVMRGLAAPFAGALSDRIGRRSVLLASAAASALVMPGFLLVHDVPTLLAWSALAGLAQGPYFPAATSLILDLAPATRRQSLLAFHYSAISVGYTLGVVPAGFVAQQGYAWLALSSLVGFALVAGLVVVGLRGALPREPRAGEGTFLSATLRAPRDPAFLALAALGFLFPLGMSLISLAVPVFARDGGHGEGAIGAVLGATGLVMALLALPINARIEATGPFRWMPLAGLLAGLSFLVFALGNTLQGIALGVLVFTFSELLFSTALPTAVAALAPPGARGAYQGAWGMVFHLAIGSALLLGGLGRDAWGWPSTWLAFAALTLLAGAGFALARRRFRAIAEARAAAAAAQARAPGSASA